MHRMRLRIKGYLSLYRVFIVVCVRRSSIFVTKDPIITYFIMCYMSAERNKLRRVFSTAIDLVKAEVDGMALFNFANECGRESQ